MRPAFVPGDRLYVDPAPGRPLAPGDVVVARDPERPGRLLLKRIAAVPGGAGGARPPPPAGYLDLAGDNAAASRDSRQFGSVPASAVVGVVWFRYAPLARRGPSPGRTFN
jgi:signal peptidase I